MATRLQAGGVGVVTEKRDFDSEDGKRTFYMLYVDFLGTSLSLSVKEDDYAAVSEGDEVKVVGSPQADNLKLKHASVQLAHGAAAKAEGEAKPPRKGLFGGKEAA